MTETGLVAIVDDDESVRESLPDLLRSFGLEVEAFASAEAFLSSDNLDRTACLVLDIVMPGMSGAELQLELARQHRNIPIVFITSAADEKLTSTVLERGAVACVFKPFREDTILGAVKKALRRN
jgi:FixJ family two-component response regulator